jgi:glycosyltransferase involved in cell wall biosynthesis
MILETANLELADLAVLNRCLDSIARQDIDITTAREVLMVHSGDVPSELVQRLSGNYAWLDVLNVPQETGYGQAKMIGVAQTTGDIIVFFDSDCDYEPGWLRGLLGGLADHPDVGLLGGETMMSSDTALGLAASVLFTFESFTHGTKIYQHRRVHLNSVAVWRQILVDHPIEAYPNVLAAGGISTTMLARSIREGGKKVARQPLSRAIHAPPNGFRHFFWRFLSMGHDAVNFYRLEAAQRKENDRREPEIGALILRFFGLAAERIRETVKKLSFILKEQPRRWLLLPLALPLLLLGIGLQVTGYISNLLFPKLIPALAPKSMKRGTTFLETEQGQAG